MNVVISGASIAGAIVNGAAGGAVVNGAKKAIVSVTNAVRDAVFGKDADNQVANSEAEAGKGEKDPKETVVAKTPAEKEAARRAAILAALGYSNPKDLQKALSSDPKNVAENYGLDGNPVAKGASSSSPDSNAQASTGGVPGIGGTGGSSSGGWSGAGAQPGGGYNPGTGGIGGGQPYRPSLADLNARADSIAAAGGARIERIYDPRGGLQQVVIHDANQQVQRELAQLAPLYREVTGRSPTGREVQTHGDHSDIVLKFGEKAQFSQEVASLGQEQLQETRRQEQAAREAENATRSSSQEANV